MQFSTLSLLLQTFAFDHLQYKKKKNPRSLEWNLALPSSQQSSYFTIFFKELKHYIKGNKILLNTSQMKRAMEDTVDNTSVSKQIFFLFMSPSVKSLSSVPLAI